MWAYISKRDALLSLCLAIIVIGIVLLIGWDNNKLIPPFPIARYHYHSSNPLKFLSNWDGPNYLHIAIHGYTSKFYASYFPLYPLLIKGLSYIIRSYLMSALLIAWAAFYGTIYFFIKVLRSIGGISSNENGLKAASILVLFPTAVFFVATYTEPLLGVLTLLSMYLVIKRKCLWLPLLMMLATLTHITGVFVVVLICLLLYEQKAKITQWLATMTGGLLGLLAFMAYLKYRFNSYYTFIYSQTHVHGWLSHGYLNLIDKVTLLNIVMIGLIIATAIYYWRQNRKSFAVYALLFLLIPIAGKQYGGFNRYVLMAFPIDFMLVDFFKKNRSAYPYVLALMAVFWTYTPPISQSPQSLEATASPQQEGDIGTKEDVLAYIERVWAKGGLLRGVQELTY